MTKADETRRRVLDAALATFLRFGYRKTSIEEVARAADLSRQAVYLHFATKEELFVAAVTHALQAALDEASACLAERERPLDQRLCAAYDAWVGRYVGVIGGDLADAGETFARPLLADYETRFVERVTKAIRGSPLALAYRVASVTPRQLAQTLTATARGLKHASDDRAAFRERLEIAVRALCLPLRSRESPARLTERSNGPVGGRSDR